jgi:hypothetical protein
LYFHREPLVAKDSVFMPKLEPGLWEAFMAAANRPTQRLAPVVMRYVARRQKEARV